MNDVIRVGFEGADDLTQRFLALEATEAYGLRKFPSPMQYRRLVDELAVIPGRQTARLVALAQKDWHVRGQTGCMFARLAALEAERLKWEYIVAEDPEIALQAISPVIDQAIENDRVEVVSLVFPWVDTAEQGVGVVRRLADETDFWLEKDATASGLLRLHLRYPVTADRHPVQAWVMAFGPFDWVPNTRRGPYFELAIRVKKKPKWIFHRLTQDRAVAHLADVPLEMSDRHWDDRWQSTLRRTRMILGAEPDDISAAKCTLAVPTELLDSIADLEEAG